MLSVFLTFSIVGFVKLKSVCLSFSAIFEDQLTKIIYLQSSTKEVSH